MKRISKTAVWFLLALLAAIAIGSVVVPWCAAQAETAAVADTAPTIDWGELITQVILWVIGVLAAAGAWALKRYVYPWFIMAVVPWLKTHNLIAVAEIAVKYAEAELGRYTGAEKWKLATALMRAKGFDINDEAVTAALKAAWETLDLQQITAGIKSAGTEE